MPSQTYARTQGRNYNHRSDAGRLVTHRELEEIVGKPEWKWLDTRPPSVVIPLTGTLILLNGIPEDTGPNGRIGVQVSNKSSHMRFTLSSATATTSYVRVIMFWALDGNFLDPATPITIAASNLLQDGTDYLSPLNKENGKSFRVRYDQTFAFAPGQMTAQVQEVYREFICDTEYSSDANPPSNITSNALYILFLPTNAGAASTTLNLYHRLNYIDG
jgi:hypothetical protein